ncbi:lipid II flippase Amj family protein [Roseovarius nubinhibens]|uniref:lipid II flippase family protein n=1 Tax=Roseovarius nubinhibens TaxID=314263 RepID=UPI001C09BF6C|nr:DUF2837 family protein [Roseovarius nubinhibens]MBU2999831.1 lipid II flippase Amj family protein [Roseovarius nubinhibens]
MSYAVIFIPISFAFVHFLEFTGTMARLGGVQAGSHLLGYSIQQAVYVGTRFFIVALLPMLGLVVDTKISNFDYQKMAMTAVLVAAAASVVAYLLQGPIVSYYVQVIKKYNDGASFVRSFFAMPLPEKRARLNIRQQFCKSWNNPISRFVIFQAAIVFSIYGTGIFASFYFASLNYEYRASISQLSGVINSMGTILLTFFVEPKISRSIDSAGEDAVDLIHGLLIGRLIGISILGPMLLLLLFGIAS